MAGINVEMGVSGVGQFRTAMNQAQQSVKTLDEQLKLNEKQYKASGDAEAYMEQKAKLLKSQMDAQKTVIAAAEKALKTMADQGVDKASASYLKMEQRLASAQSALLDMQNGMEGVGDAAEESAGKADDMARAVNNIGRRIDLGNVIAGIDAITSALGNAAKKAKEVGDMIWENIVDSARYSDDIATQAMMLNMTPEEFQKVKGVLDTVAELTVQEWMKAKTKVQKAIYDPTADQIDILKFLGIDTHEILEGKYGQVEGAARDYEEIFWEIGKRLREKVQSGELTQDMADVYANAFFGKDYAHFNSIFELGEEGFKAALDDQAAASNEAIEANAALNDKLIQLENTIKAVKVELTSGLAPSLKKVAEAINELMKKVLEYLQTDEGKEKMKALGDAVDSLFEGIRNIDVSSALTTFGNAIDSLTEGLLWIKDNGNEVVIAIEAIAGALALLKVGSGVLQLFRTLKSGSWLLGKEKKVETPKSDDLSDDIVRGGLVEAVRQWLKTQEGKLMRAADKAGHLMDSIGPYGAGAVGDWFMNNTHVGRFIRGEETWDDLVRYAQEYGESIKQNAETFTEDWNRLFETAGEALSELGGNVKDKAWEILKSALGELTEEEEAKLQEIDKEINARRIAEGIESWVSGILVTAKNEADASGWFGGNWGIVENELLDDMPFLNVTPAQWEAMEAAWDAIRESGWMSDESLNALNNLQDRFDFSEEGMQALTEVYEAMRGLAQFGWTGENLPEWWVDRDFWPKDPVEMPVDPTLPEDAATDLQTALNQMNLIVPVSPSLTAEELGAPKANGIFSVPFNGYPAILHKGERVVPARQVEAESRSYNSNLYVESMYMNNGADAEGLAAAMAAAQRRTMAGFGS